eukprot:1390611-Rhodomonas_salina.1
MLDVRLLLRELDLLCVVAQRLGPLLARCMQVAKCTVQYRFLLRTVLTSAHDGKVLLVELLRLNGIPALSAVLSGRLFLSQWIARSYALIDRNAKPSELYASRLARESSSVSSTLIALVNSVIARPLCPIDMYTFPLATANCGRNGDSSLCARARLLALSMQLRATA